MARFNDERDFEDGGVPYDDFSDFIDDDGADYALDDDVGDDERYADDDFDDEVHDAFASPQDDYDDRDDYVEPAAPRRQTYQAPLRRGRPSLTPLRMPTYDAVRWRNRNNDS